MKPELFILEPGLWQGAAEEDIVATCSGLREMGLYHLPYERVTVRLPANEVMSKGGKPVSAEEGRGLFCDLTIGEETGQIRIVGYNSEADYALDVTNDILAPVVDWSEKAKIEWVEKAERDLAEKGGGPRAARLEAIRRATVDFLIAMLATRNVVKTRTENKLAKLGIGQRKYKNRYRYTTTITLPRPEDMESDSEHPPTGAAKAPHLRRGHIRRQHYGPQRAFIKKIWIEPVFVNADPDFVSQRGAYNVSKGHAHKQENAA